MMTADLRAAIVFHSLGIVAVASMVWLAALDRPWLAGLAAWAAFLAVFLGGRCHTAHLRTVADQTIRNRRNTTTKENTTR